MVARGRRPILSLSAVHPAPCESVAARARCADYSMRHRFRCARITRSSGLEKSVDRWRRFVPCVSSVDLLSILDSARSARPRRCARRDRKIPAALVGTIDEFCDLALAACLGADQLWLISRRRRQSHRRRLHLAISAHRTRHGWTPHLRAKSAVDFSTDKDSGRSVRCQHRLQRVPDTETRHPRGRAVLFISQHPAHICDRSCRCGTLCLRCGYSSFFVGRTTFLTTSQTPGAAKPRQRSVTISLRVANRRAVSPYRAKWSDNSGRSRVRRSDRQAWH